MRRILLTLVLISTIAAACSSASSGGATAENPPSSRSPFAPPEPFCSRLVALDQRLRDVRSLSDTTASVSRYLSGADALDRSLRWMRSTAPANLALADVESQNRLFGQIVRAMPANLDGPTARAQVALVLEAYNVAVYAALVAGCGPEIAGRG
jgi:hypothetical protein